MDLKLKESRRVSAAKSVELIVWIKVTLELKQRDFWKMELTREFTLRLNFVAGARKPTDKEMFDLFRKQKWKCCELSAFYREEHFIFVRFKNQGIMNRALKDIGSVFMFDYADGRKERVYANDANVKSTYVRLFGLPPEIGNVDIELALSKFGNVQQVVREKYSIDTGYPIWNGNRGVHMELTSEMPRIVEIHGVSARIFYEGQCKSCFVCGSKDHQRRDCLERRPKNNRQPSSVNENGCSFDGIFDSAVVQPDSHLVAQHSTNLESLDIVQQSTLNVIAKENGAVTGGNGKTNQLNNKTNEDHSKQKNQKKQLKVKGRTDEKSKLLSSEELKGIKDILSMVL